MDFNLLVKKIDALPSLPQAYHKCCELLEQKDTDSAALSVVVSNEPAMALSVLKVVNSAFYNLPRKIERLDHAISIIGHDKFRDLILTTTVVEAMSKVAGGEVNMEAFWRHSVLTGLIARRVGLYSYLPNNDRLHIAGLIHDVGQLIYFSMLNNKAVEVCDLVSKLGIETHVAEQKILGFNHHDIGAALCKAWKLPEWLIDIISNYNKPKKSRYCELECHVIFLANQIADQHFPGITLLNKERVDSTINVVETPLSLSQQDIEMSTEEALEQLEQVVSSLIPNLNSV